MVDTLNVIDGYLNGEWWTKENANIDKSVMALNNRIAESAIKEWWLTRNYTTEIRKAYTDGFFHIHNLGHLSVYCAGWDLSELLLKGFKGRMGRQTSGPAKHFRTALGHIYNFLYTLQGESSGAQALSNFDTYLAPFIAEDNLSQRQVDQSIQEFIFNMNVPTRVGGQQPFTNVTIDQNIPTFMEDEPVIVGGRETDDGYGSFQDEIEMFNHGWWNSRMKGDFDGRTQPFPIETINVTKEFNWDDEDLFEVVALRGSPYFANFINTDMKPEDVRSMCCRLRIPLEELIKRGGGYFGASAQTGSIGVCTMNLPLMGYISKNEDEFFELLDLYMNIAMRSLVIKRTVIEEKIREGLYPYSRVYLESVFERFGDYWKNHFSTIGLIGMNECLINMFGNTILDEDGLKFSVKVLEFMRDKAVELQQETGDMINIEATPVEGTAYRLAMKDKEEYPNIITAGTEEVPYYTNSTQIPVSTEESLGYYLWHQDQIQPLYTGGTVFHVWNGESVPQWESVSKLMERIMNGYSLPYVTYSPTTSVCPTHGFISGEYWTCPKCGEECEVWQRVVGYFSEVHRWNGGKRQEFSERQEFSYPFN